MYVREAHPIDGWRMESNDRVGVAVAQPKSDRQRVEVATQCHDLLEMSMPVLVDSVDDRVGRAYSGMPDRLYVLDREGKVAFKSGRGPFWFSPGEMEQSLIMLLLDESTAGRKPPEGGPVRPQPGTRPAIGSGAATPAGSGSRTNSPVASPESRGTTALPRSQGVRP